jgi:hypothetical protein
MVYFPGENKTLVMGVRSNTSSKYKHVRHVCRVPNESKECSVRQQVPLILNMQIPWRKYL